MADNRRILIVDDNPAIHGDFKKVLGSDDSAMKEDAEFRDLEAKLFGADPSVPSPSKLKPEFEIDFAFQGEQAIELVAKAHADGRPYAMVITDVRMPPGLDGVETIRRIWSEHPKIEMVICTAFSDYSSEDIIQSLGVTDRLLILKKPFDPVSVKQMALTLTTKWNMSRKIEAQIEDLEKDVLSRTQMLLQASKMSALGEMAAGVAHEINNPLAIINTLAFQIREHAEERNLDRHGILDATTKIESTSMRIARIIAALRTLSRDGSTDAFIRTPVSKLIDEVFELCRERFNKNRVSLSLAEVPADLAIDCRGSEIGQVLLNLLNNAHDAVCTLDDARRWIRIEVGVSVAQLEISIIDGGNGVPKHLRDKIFQPFFTTKDIGCGTGLGLSIATGIVRAHHGSFELDQSSASTRFIVKLPLLQAERAIA